MFIDRRNEIIDGMPCPYEDGLLLDNLSLKRRNLHMSNLSGGSRAVVKGQIAKAICPEREGKMSYHGDS